MFDTTRQYPVARRRRSVTQLPYKYFILTGCSAAQSAHNRLLSAYCAADHTKVAKWIWPFSSVVEHSSANPKVPGLIPGPVSYQGSWIMMRHVPCILLLKWSTTFQRLWVYRIRKEKGATPGILSTIDGSTLPQDCVEEQLC